MLKNYLTIAVRHLTRHKLFSSINIICLAVGITFSLLTGMYVLNEKSVNGRIKDLHNQYVITSQWKQQNIGAPITTLGPLARTMKDEYPNLVANYYRFDPVVNIVSVGDKHFRTPIAAGDTTFVSMYGFPLLHGDPAHAFRDNLSAVVTENFARKFFDRTDVINQVITIQTPADGNKHQFVITAVLKDMPYNTVSNFTTNAYDVYLPMDANQYFQGGDRGDNWSNVYMVAMLELRKGVKPENLAHAFKQTLEKYQPPFVKGNLTVELAGMANYYLRDNNGAVQRMLTALGSIAALILLLAVINFININIGTSIHRLKEIGLRKVLGGTRRQLIIQHMTEAIVLTFVATIISLGLYEFLRPVFAQLLYTTLDHVWDMSINGIFLILSLIIGVGLVSGIYPSFVLSSFSTVTSVKGKISSGRGGLVLRKSLLVIQFTLAVAVFIISMNISKQVSFFFNKDLGFNKDQVMIISSLPRQWDSTGIIKMEGVKTQLQDVPNIKGATLSYDIPDGNGAGNMGIYLKSNTDLMNVGMIAVDADFANVYDLQLKEGSFLPANDVNSAVGRIVINEATENALEWTSAVGKKLRFGAANGPEETVVGVVKNFHLESLQKAVTPLIIASLNEPFTRAYRYYSIKLNGPQAARTIDVIQDKFKNMFPDAGFEYSFMDNKFQALYESEMRLRKATGIATVLNFIIVFMGIFGILAFTLVKRNKEIAVRKVLGAEVGSIIGIFLKEYGLLIVISNLVAWPIAYMISRNWLQNYAYRIHQDLFSYLIPFLTILVAAYVLITAQCFKSANANPVNNLRTE